MRKRILSTLAMAGAMSSAVAIAEVNLSAEHHFVAATEVVSGSQAVFDVTITNSGSEDLNTLVFTAADSSLTHDIRNPLFALTELSAGAKTTVQITLDAPVAGSYFDAEDVLLLHAQGYNAVGESISLPVVVEGGAQ